MASTTDNLQVNPGLSDDTGSGKDNGTSSPSGDRASSRERSSDRSQSNSGPTSNALKPSTNGTSNHSKHPSTGRPPLSSPNSVASSREASPIRPLFRSLNSSSTSRSVSRSRRNSEEMNLSRQPSDTSINNLPSGPALQKKLANVHKPHLPPPSQDQPPSPELRKPSKSAIPSKTGDPSRQWPISPRLKSPPPPPSSTRNGQSHTSAPLEDDTVVANTSSKRQPNGSRETGQGVVKQDGGNVEDNRSRSTPRVLTRGTSATGSVLATVQEAGTPIAQTAGDPFEKENSDDLTPKPAKPAPESGSDSGGNHEDVKNDGPKEEEGKLQQLAPTKKSDDLPSKRSFTSLNAARGKPGESSMKNMIVETETVSSVPQLSLGGGTSDRNGAGRKESGTSIRLKASDETIRPKKEKKKQARKSAAISTGTVSSKADIFEAKVASAVDDANTSDSEETFVYESNPPDPHPGRQHRYHSRTPSATSMASQIDQYGGSRSRPGMREVSHGIVGKRSMKFTNNTYNTMDDNGDELNGSGRGSSRTARHYHSGRPPRNGTHQSVLDHSPFTFSQSFKSPRHFNGNRHSKSTNPKNSPTFRSNGSFKTDGDVYDYDYDAEGADDERTPLVGSGRNRIRMGRRPNSASMRQMEYIEQQRRGCFSRYGVCILLLILIVVMIGGATTFVVGVSKSVRDIQVNEIQNVLASEQEIMLDLDVEAINPNLIPITMSDMDVSIFAKSRFVGRESFWRDHGPHPDPLPRNTDSRRRSIMARTVRAAPITENTVSASSSPKPEFNTTGTDRGTDPIPEDPAGDPQTMLLGRIFHFDSSLTFDPSPWKHELSHSTGQVRLTKPGNRTEEGGSLRWERVLQHPFELIVRGVVKYQLPLGARDRTASISSMIKVDPDDDPVGGGEGNDDDPDEVPNPDEGFHTS